MKITKFIYSVTFVLMLLSVDISLAAVATEDPDALAKPSDKEIETYMGAVKEQEVTQQLLKSPLFKDCSAAAQGEADEAARKDSVRKCVAKKIDEDLGEDELKKLSDDFDLSSFDKKAAKSSKSIREYLNDRLANAIYGEDKDASGKLKALKDRTIVSHDIYYQLYMEQIGKNTLLMVSQYCLENFGYKKPDNLIAVVPGNKPEDLSVHSLGNVMSLDPSFDPNGDKSAYNLVLDEDSLENKFKQSTAITNFWSKSSDIQEYKVCNYPTQQQCDQKNTKKNSNGSDEIIPTRSISIIEKLKEVEFMLARKDSNILKHKYEFCAMSVVKNMCNIYKCNTVYKSNSSKTQRDKCNEFGIDISNINPNPTVAVAGTGINLDNDKTKGQVACNVMNRLKDYRKMLIATGNLKKSLLDGMKTMGQIGFSNTGVKAFVAKGSKSVDNLTSISSTDLVDKVKKLAGSEEEANKLKEKCMEEGPGGKYTLKSGAKTDSECEVLLSQLSEEDFNEIQLETEAKTALFIKKVDKVDREELKKFLLKNGLGEYLSQWKNSGEDFAKVDKDGKPVVDKRLTDEELIVLIKQDYQAKRMSELDAIKAKFDKEVALSKNGPDQNDINGGDQFKLDEDNIAEQTIGNIELHKKRVETLFQYSNIVSSYLTVTSDEKDENGNNKKESGNTTGRSLEIADAKDGNKEELEYFSEGTEQARDSGTMNYLNVLDAVLGDTTNDKDSKNQ